MPFEIGRIEPRRGETQGEDLYGAAQYMEFMPVMRGIRPHPEALARVATHQAIFGETIQRLRSHVSVAVLRP
jgi:hypothetical protein